MTAATSSPLRGPVRTDERALAPDLARGLMLLLIALANTPWYLYGSEPGISAIHPQDGSVPDKIAQLLIITTIDMRVYPMFAFLFGYGMVQLFRRQVEAGTEERVARRVLRRRNWWLLAFGFVHAALLWMGDILGAYGLAGLIMVAIFFRRRDKTLLIAATIGMGLLTLAMLSAAVGSVFAAQVEPTTEPESFLGTALVITGEDNYLTSILYRIVFWSILIIFQGLLTLVIPIALLLAFWAARRQILERPGEHLVLLRRTAVIGIAIGWLGGLVHVLSHLGLLPIPDHVTWVFSAVSGPTGLLGGLGYVAAFALLAHWLTSRNPNAATDSVPVVAITAVGRRSLSCYLAQSVICAPLLAGWGLGLGAALGSASMALFAVGVWAVTVVGAYLLEIHGRRGPAEVLLRRLVYRNITRSQPAVATRP